MSLIEWIDDLKKVEVETEFEFKNEEINIKEVKCNNTLHESFFGDMEYKFWNDYQNNESKTEEAENVKEQLTKLSRRFNIDLSPNIFYSRGKFIELLISSDTAKYCEFRMISQIMTQNDDMKIEKVIFNLEISLKGGF